ncbi:MAG: YfcE family phosphodiesterase [Bacteroidetes bacterium HGW-Bacteroidetes-1]|jgi:hypothetical protein|nr:MAG: YfcE family phosphodiesterase [Bacteroidetes bacterium HGW-Bacteroidetes-1]
MKKIGLLSDTHGYIHPRVFVFFKDCDEIWHAGDIGSTDVSDRLSKFKPFRGVYGNIDGQQIRLQYPEFLQFVCEEAVVLITHIGGYPGRYLHTIKQKIETLQPDLFIAGHSHILKVIPDKKNNLLFLNPGAAGNAGFHQKITFIRFSITAKQIHDLEIMEIDR